MIFYTDPFDSLQAGEGSGNKPEAGHGIRGAHSISLACRILGDLCKR